MEYRELSLEERYDQRIIEDKKATDALQFYNDHADRLHIDSEHDAKYPDFNWHECRNYCRTERSTYSLSRFMKYVAIWFDTTVIEMKQQWDNIE